ncbi:alpha/beta hydrolase-fold protein [Frankia sp. AgB32]|uniref:alpha/beta hydrolase-fold protein n=1 Tax=Frankia sp. AgB32 TaxID=631119 RepID=UPI00200F90CB|nr:alpha/beta hydrolase-fold protein [Frankia sp. AgB32]MCK9895295.1 esterase family protein [Frankia sp. AgB32]
MGPSRRTLLLAGLTAGCAVGGSPATPAPGPSAGTHEALTAAAAATGPATVTTTTFRSAARRRQVAMSVVTPAGGGRGLPVCLVLHGRGDDARGAVGLLGLDGLLPAAIRAGTAPFVLVTLDGGTTYWHRRSSGDDPETMILGEVLPRLAAAGLRTGRFAVLGWSMGGYGALLLARRHPELVVAAAASSPAMWHTYGASAPGAFDSAADFAAHEVLGTPPAPGVAYRIDCGAADPFAAVSRQAVAQLHPSEYSLGTGGHTPAYWRSVAPAQLAFLGTALARAV